MKTKKLLSLLLVAALGLMLLSGCTPAMSSYMEESAALEEWPGTDFEGTMTMTVSAPGQPDMTMPMTINGTMQGPSATAVGHFNVTYAPITVDGQTLQLPALDFFFDGSNMNFYMSKNYFVETYQMSHPGEPLPPALADMAGDYIQVDMNEGGSMGMFGLSTKGMQYLSSPAYKADAQKLMDTILGGDTPAFSFTQDGRTYTFEATGDQLIDTGVMMLGNIMAEWDTLLPQFKDMAEKSGMPMTDQDLAQLEQLKVAYDANAINEAATQAKAALAGTNIKFTDSFTDTTNTTNMDLTLNLGNQGLMKMAMEGVATVNEDAKVTLPTNITKMSMDQLMMLSVNPNGDVMVFYNGTPVTFDQKPVIVNDRVLVPYRAISEAMGNDVEWDEATRTVTATKGTDNVLLTIDSTEAIVNGETFTLDSPAIIIEGRTMVPLRFLSEGLGNQVEWVDTMRIVTISDGTVQNDNVVVNPFMPV